MACLVGHAFMDAFGAPVLWVAPRSSGAEAREVSFMQQCLQSASAITNHLPSTHMEAGTSKSDKCHCICRRWLLQLHLQILNITHSIICFLFFAISTTEQRLNGFFHKETWLVIEIMPHSKRHCFYNWPCVNWNAWNTVRFWKNNKKGVVTLLKTECNIKRENAKIVITADTSAEIVPWT